MKKKKTTILLPNAHENECYFVDDFNQSTNTLKENTAYDGKKYKRRRRKPKKQKKKKITKSISSVR